MFYLQNVFKNVEPSHLDEFIEELHHHVQQQDNINLSDFIQVTIYSLDPHFITLPSMLQNFGETISGEELHEILREIDSNMNGQVELDEYLQVLSDIDKSLSIVDYRYLAMSIIVWLLIDGMIERCVDIFIDCLVGKIDRYVPLSIVVWS
jgi:hypothetical protein